MSFQKYWSDFFFWQYLLNISYNLSIVIWSYCFYLIYLLHFTVQLFFLTHAFWFLEIGQSSIIYIWFMRLVWLTFKEAIERSHRPDDCWCCQSINQIWAVLLLPFLSVADLVYSWQLCPNSLLTSLRTRPSQWLRSIALSM